MATNFADAKAATTDMKPMVPAAEAAAPIILDFGKHRKKLVTQLRQGDGKLMNEVSAALAELQVSGAIGAGAQPVIIIVQQKRRKPRGLLPGLL